MKFRVLDERIAVSLIEQDEKTAGGIIIPNNANKTVLMGRVIETGFKFNYINTEDIVFFDKSMATEIRIGNENVLILKETDILAIIDSEDWDAESNL